MAACYNASRFGMSISPDDLSSRLHEVHEDILHAALNELSIDERTALVQSLRHLAARLNITAELAWSMRSGKPISIPRSTTSGNMAGDMLYLQLPHTYSSTSSIYSALRMTAAMQEQFTHVRSLKLSYADIDWLEELEIRARTLAFEFLTELAPMVEQVRSKAQHGLVSPMSRTWSDSTTSSFSGPKQPAEDWSSNDSSPSTSWATRGW
ncbi:hypothetical protein CALVIDRAFT_525569 [Calocera viscosa TUFC12733]|uniref:Uncharacterized protein n=1 Tax=Calocera viscosa (strain TUFC12733) TaxID=1330018 RepID=A0A167PQC3_CALVF|nr:hypothetical protein CALVIDRAFT_525569 [Calocera viscosa TUFC12733]